MTSVSFETVADLPFEGLPFDKGETGSTTSFDAVFIAAKEAWHWVESTDSIPLAALKASLVITGAAALTATAIVLVAFAVLFHIVTFPFTLNEWSLQGAKDHAFSGLKELIALFNAVTTYFSRPEDAKIHQEGETPILLVHGYLHNSSAWFHHIEKLKEAGIGPIYTIDLGSPFNSVDDYAEKVGKKVSQIRLRHFQETGQNTQVVLAGHSMGGLVSSRFATLDQDHLVKSVITLGTPLQGTMLASMGIGASARDMQIGTKLSEEVNEGILKRGDIKFYHVASETDLVIRPTTSAHPTVTGDYIKKISLTDSGHNSLLYSDNISQIIIDSYAESIA